MHEIVMRLTPLAEALALIETDVKPAPPSEVDVAAAVGCVLARQSTAPAQPSTAVALQDGWALRADDTLGAGSYAPALLASAPPRVETGQPMPEGADCIAPIDDVRVSGGQAEVLVALAPGDGVLPAGGDHDGAAALGRIGERVNLMHVAALAALGIERVHVRRPRLVVASGHADPALAAVLTCVTADAQRRGAVVQQTDSLEAALAMANADAVLGIGDIAGPLAVRGVALAPGGETAALGFLAHRPVLLLPRRFDAALAAWLMLGRPLLDRLAGASDAGERPETLALARKVASAVGLTELIPVRRDGDTAIPLAGRYWPLSVLARADGYLIIPPNSEGSSAGSAVQVWPWP